LGEWAEPSDEQRDEPDRVRAGRVTDTPGCETAMLLALGSVVRHLREQQNMTETALADAAGITPGRLAAIEAGQLDPPFDVLLALADGLRIPSGELVGRTETEPGDAR